MDRKCELIDNCGFFNNYNQQADVVVKGWIKIFCESQVKAAHCKRKKIKEATGNSPPDTMTPTGTIL